MMMEHSLIPIFLLGILHICIGANTGGHWGEWGAMSPCSVTCGSGTLSQQRVWIPGPGEPIPEKPFTSTQTFSCTDPMYPECPQDGMWSGWGAWTECTKACGGGTRNRIRNCIGRTLGGKDCEGEGFDKEDCKREPCPALPPNFDLSQCNEKTNFTCTSGKMCVLASQKCDQTVQCHDGSDEKNCTRYYYGGQVRYDLSRGGNGDGVTHVFSPFTIIVGLVMSVISLIALH